jgi:hypothetical protein
MAKMMLNLKDAYQQIILQQPGTDGVDGHFSFRSPDQSTFMGASFVVASQDLGRVPVTKVECGSRSPTCTGYASGSQEHEYHLEKSV